MATKYLSQDVEAVLMEHPAVADAAVIAIPHATLGEDVAAAVVLSEGARASESELRLFAATRLAAFKVPRRIVLIDSIPRTSTGKARRGVLAEQLRSQKPQSDLGMTPALAPVENVLVDIWCRILGVEHMEVHDDFFALGGDSLTATEMLTESQRRLQTGSELLGRVDFFDSPTIQALARIVVECGANPGGEPAAGNRILALRTTGSRLPFFCFPASAQDPYYLRHFSKNLDEEQPFFVVCHSEPVRDKRIVPVADLARFRWKPFGGLGRRVHIF